VNQINDMMFRIPNLVGKLHKINFMVFGRLMIWFAKLQQINKTCVVINGSSFDLTGFMGTDAGQSPSSLDDTAATSWSLISQGHRSMETLLPCVFSVFICASPCLLFSAGVVAKQIKTLICFF